MAGRGRRPQRSLRVEMQSNANPGEQAVGMTSPNTGSSPSPTEERSAVNMSTVQHGNGTESEVVNGDTQVGSKRKRRSVVWNDFVEVIVDGKLKAECVFCHKKLSGEQSHGTSHLRSHLETCDAKKSIDSKQQKLRLTKGDAGKINLENYVFDQNVARKELVIMICVHEYPLSMVDHAGFRSFCASLQPMFKMVSRNTIKNDIIGLHGTQKNAMIQYFAKFNHRVAVTSDLWTAGHQKKGYMVVTAHFIDEDWELKSFLLRFMYVPCPHNSEVICEALHQVLVEWHLERKISTVTLDNCAANDKAIWNMEDKLDSNSLMLQGKLVHMRCCAHILNLIVQDGMSVLKDGIERVRDSVAYWSATPKRHERFEKMARTLNIPYTKKIGLDCKTRWNSTYVMLSTALPYQEIFYRLSRQVKQFDCCPTIEDWNFAKEVCDKLKIFYDITELLSGTKYVTANIFFPKICCIRLAIRKWSASNNELMQKMSDEMTEKFNKYWLDVHGLMAMATILDPRYKTNMLQALFGSLYGYEHAAKKVDEIKKLMVELLLEYKESDEPAASVQVAVQVDKDQEDEADKLLDQYMMQQPVVSSQLRTELDLYLEEPTLPRTQKVDIITWWKVGGMKYPTLQRIARDILPIPVTTVASESAFSTSGRILSAHRSRLAPKTAEALMCMQAWSRADMFGIDNVTSDQFAIQSVLEDEQEAMEECESEITIED